MLSISEFVLNNDIYLICTIMYGVIVHSPFEHYTNIQADKNHNINEFQKSLISL